MRAVIPNELLPRTLIGVEFLHENGKDRVKALTSHIPPAQRAAVSDVKGLARVQAVVTPQNWLGNYTWWIWIGNPVFYLDLEGRSRFVFAEPVLYIDGFGVARGQRVRIAIAR